MLNHPSNNKLLLAIALITHKADSETFKLWYDTIRISLWLELDAITEEDREFEQSLLPLDDLHYNTLSHDLSMLSGLSKEYISFYQVLYHSSQQYRQTKEFKEFVYLLSLI